MATSASSSPITGLQPVFVVGHPRSGTTLIQQVLSVHQELWSGPETFLFSHILEPSEAGDVRQFTPDDLTGVFNRLREKSNINVSDAARTHLTALARARELNEAVLLDAVMQDLKPVDQGGQRWLEKTPYHVYHLLKLWRLFPDARIISLIRDPRDVISSRVYRRKPGPYRVRRVYKNTKSWNAAVEAIEAQQGDPRLLVVRYEDFITEPERLLVKMAEHIGIQPDLTALERFTESSDRVTINKESASKALNNTPALIDQRGVWRKRLSADEVQVIEVFCAETMIRCGYSPENQIRPGMREQLEAQFAQAPGDRHQKRSFFRRVINRLKRIITR